MDINAIVSVLSSAATLVGVLLTVWKSQSKTLYRIEQLERKVERHNTVIERTYKLEARADLSEEKQAATERRVDNLAAKMR